MLNKSGDGAEEEQEAEERLETSEEMIKLKISTDPISKEEIKKAIQETKAGKALGVDNINPEMIKAHANISAEILYPLFGKIWKEEKIPKEWEKGLLVKISGKVTYLIVITGMASHYCQSQVRCLLE
jgi:hypothetical protein